MGSIDINIIQRGAASDFEWSAGPGRIVAADLGKIGEMRTDNGRALNALPTPFARFFVFKEAFRRVLEERNDPRKQAGRAYEQLVSNCLDAFELLYRKNFHENMWKADQRIKVREWNRASNLDALMETVPILGNAIESYYADDIGEDRLFFVILVQQGREYLLATSSPYTGFITPPDLDLKKDRNSQYAKFSGEMYQELRIERKSSGKYFQDVQLFDKRPADFKNYMFWLFSRNASTVDSKYQELRDYIQSFSSDKDIITDWPSSSLQPILSENNTEVDVNGVRIMKSVGVDSVNYFADAIFKVPYRISSQFRTFEYINDKTDRDYDYLFPLSEQAIKVFGKDSFTATCQERNKAVEICFNVNGKEYCKTYREEGFAIKQGEGVIIALSTAKVNLDLALFPNVLSAKQEENNYFKVLVSASDENNRKTFTIDNVSLDFYSDIAGKYNLIEPATDNSFERGVHPAAIRSKQGTDVKYGTKYYEVFNASFDLILATISIDERKHTFALIPIWDTAEQTNKEFDYAIDLGTSNTYISRKEKAGENEPQQLTMDKPIVSYLHDQKGSMQQNAVTRWENGSPAELSDAFKTEFLPPFIDGKAYRFPVRTALCHTGVDTSNISLFDNSNIAFFYEKSQPVANQKIITNIKWSSDESSLRVFIRELLLIVKADILQEHGNISKTGIIWFRPLSFMEQNRQAFEKIWREEAKYILNLGSASEQIKCYTESEAPYYYFNKKDEYKSVESVAMVDIGGGSTDFVYFQNGEAKIANSVHFGCDVMWGNGFDQFHNSRRNGIFNKYRDAIRFAAPEMQELNTSMINNNDISTQDIINFWIGNSKETKISDKLRNDFSFAFAYHYTATIYYLASMLKAKGMSYPRTIAFSGNGSRYIDQYITTDASLIKDITQLIVSDVFGEGINNIQIVLPEIRKESTCYGGLYYKEGATKPTAVVYYGDGKLKECQDIKELKSRYKSEIKDKVVSEIKTMNSAYMDVLTLLIQKGAVSRTLKTDKILDVVNAGIEDTLDSKFQTEIIDKYSEQEQFNDTLFFIPIIDALLNLTNYKVQ